MKTQFGAGAPFEARVVERRADGSAVVEVPVIVVTAELDLSKTEGGGDKTVSFGAAELRQMADNFPSWPRPVGIGFSGIDGHQDVREGPQMAFVNSVRFDGDSLVAQIELSPSGALLVVDDRAFRGFSMEADKNPVTPTGAFDGWVLTGGIFTNYPATDTQFRIAAEGEIESEATALAHGSFNFTATVPAGKGEEMADDATTAHLEAAKKEADEKLKLVKSEKAELQALNAKVLAENAQLKCDLSAAKSDATTRGSQAEGLKAKCDQLERENARLSAEVNRTKDETTAKEIMALMERGVECGLAAYFEGCEKDPLNWFKAKGFSSVDTLSQFIESIPDGTSKAVAAAASAGKESADGDAVKALSEEDEKVLAKLGLDPRYSGVESANDLIALREKKAEKAT